MREDKSFAYDLDVQRGIVSSRVALLLRSAEIQPLLSDLLLRRRSLWPAAAGPCFARRAASGAGRASVGRATGEALITGGAVLGVPMNEGEGGSKLRRSTGRFFGRALYAGVRPGRRAGWPV